MASVTDAARAARSGSRSGAVDNSAKSAKEKLNEAAKHAPRPMAAGAGTPAYHQVQPNVQPGSVAAALSGRASNISNVTADLIAVMIRLGMYDIGPVGDQTASSVCSTENVLAVLDNHVDTEVRSLEAFLTAAIYGSSEKELCDDDCDQEEVKGGVAETNYGSKFFYHADAVHSRLRDIDRKLIRIRNSLLGERPTAEAKTANNDSTASLHQCVTVLINRIDTTVENVTELTSDIRNGLLGE